MIGDILQPTHLLFILVIALLVLGPKRLPEAGRSLGRGLRDFRMAMSGEEPERRDEVTTPAAATAPAPSAPDPASATAPAPAPVASPVAQPVASPVAASVASPVAEPVEAVEPAPDPAGHAS
jgi:sec-independent protein translocase protein TatA